MKIIQVENLKKNYGSFTALKNVNLEVNSSDIYGFIGPNGAGKTTLIRVLLGILKPTNGISKVFSMNSWEHSLEINKKLSYVPGDINLWPNMTGKEVLELFSNLKGNYNKKKEEELIERFKLDTSKKCRTYSKGNRQKVALISAFSSNSELFILDEPTSGLDPLMERVFQDIVFELKKEEKTVLLSSHILSEVEKLCDKISIIRDGEIIKSGTLENMRHLTRTIIDVKTQIPIEDIEKINYIHDLKFQNNEYSFQVDSEKLGDLIKYISKYNIIKLESMPPALEDLFMRHYQSN